MLEKYGVKHNFQHGKLRDKAKVSMVVKYGVEHNWQKGKLRERDDLKLVEKYGKDNIIGGINFRIASKKVMLTKYGAENPQQVPEIFEKAQKTRFKQKEYNWLSGEISLLQGYEPIVLTELENSGYTFDEVITSAVAMPEIKYFFEGKEHRYYPDFYIPSENKIIEVKSDYTLQADWEQNQAKFEATRNLGYDFILEVR